MKKIKLILFVLISLPIYAQKSTGRIPISTTKSQNEIYSIKSISYDTEFPNLKGESIVYENDKEIYRINRSFDLYNSEKYTLIISNNGKTVVYLINDIFWNGKEYENVTIYNNGILSKTYNMLEFTGCDSNKEKCSFIYDNYNIIDYKKSKFGTKKYKKKFKKNTSEDEIFLNENYIVLDNDILYLTDSRKIVTIFDVNTMKVINHKDFKDIYTQIKYFRKPKTNISYYKPSYKYIPDFKDAKTNKTISETISEISGLKYIPISDSTFHKFKLYRVNLKGYLNKNGRFEIEKLETDQKLNESKIMDFINKTKFKSDFLPKEVDKQYFRYFFGGYRSFNDSIAESDTKLAKLNRLKEFKKRKTLDSIKGFYIPKNLKESILHLDTKLSFEYKEKIKNAKSIWEFNSHMSPLGMWIRNNWGINGGSRLLKYFNDREVTNRDDISAIILKHYQKWLLNNRNVWSEWEKENPKKE